MAATSSYLRAVSSAVGQGLLTAAWIASGGLPPHQRRAVRVAATAAVVAVGVAAERKDDRVVTWTEEGGIKVESPDGVPEKPSGAASAVGIAFGIGMVVGRRQVEKRWLARLQRAGHEHPHRALAWRIGLLSVAATLPGNLMKAHQARAEPR